MIYLTDKEIEEIIWDAFCKIPSSGKAQQEREWLVALVAEVKERRRNDRESRINEKTHA